MRRCPSRGVTCWQYGVLLGISAQRRKYIGLMAFFGLDGATQELHYRFIKLGNQFDIFFWLERTMSDINRNPAVRILRQLTTEDVMGFTRDEIVGRLGLKSMITAEERVYFQDIFTLMEERLVWHNKIREEQKAKRLEQFNLPVSRYLLSTPIRPQKQMSITRTVQQLYLPKKQEIFPDNKQPLQKTSNNETIKSLEPKKIEQSKQTAPLQSAVQSLDSSTTIDSIHLRNPAVQVLKKLTHEAIESFTRKQVVGKLGLNKLLTPQQRVYCQQQIIHLQRKLAEHDKAQLLQELQNEARKTREREDREMENMLFRRRMHMIVKGQITTIFEKKIPAIIEPTRTTEKQRPTVADKQTQTTTFVQRPSLTKNKPQKSTTKQPLENTSKNQVKEQTNSTAVQPSSRSSSILEPFCSLPQKPFLFNSQKGQCSQEWMEIDDEEIELLIKEDQEETGKESIHKMERKKRD